MLVLNNLYLDAIENGGSVHAKLQ